jgi:uncharacterized membrane protein
MVETEKNLTEQKMDQVIGNLLRFGVFIAGAIVLFGGILYLIRHGGEIPDYQTFHSESEDLRTFGGIFRDVLSFNARGIIQLGFLLLIATPVARVAFSVYAFIHQRDWIYVLITMLVLTLLIFSLIGGHL